MLLIFFSLPIFFSFSSPIKGCESISFCGKGGQFVPLGCVFSVGKDNMNHVFVSSGGLVVGSQIFSFKMIENSTLSQKRENFVVSV